MIFDIIQSSIDCKEYFVEIPERYELYYDAWEMLEMCNKAGFHNVSIRCFGGYENALLIED